MADEILTDPDGHFPYARQRAEEAGVPADVAGWCAHVVAAQEAARRDPSPQSAQALQDVMAAAQEFTRHRRTNNPGAASAARPETIHGKGW